MQLAGVAVRGKIRLGIPLQDLLQTKNFTQTPLYKRRRGPSDRHLKWCSEAKTPSRIREAAAWVAAVGGACGNRH